MCDKCEKKSSFKITDYGPGGAGGFIEPIAKKIPEIEHYINMLQTSLEVLEKNYYILEERIHPIICDVTKENESLMKNEIVPTTILGKELESILMQVRNISRKIDNLNSKIEL